MKPTIHLLVQRWFADGAGWAYDSSLPADLRQKTVEQIADVAAQYHGEEIQLTEPLEIGSHRLWVLVRKDENCPDGDAISRLPHIDIGVLVPKELEVSSDLILRYFQYAQENILQSDVFEPVKLSEIVPPQKKTLPLRYILACICLLAAGIFAMWLGTHKKQSEPEQPVAEQSVSDQQNKWKTMQDDYDQLKSAFAEWDVSKKEYPEATKLLHELDGFINKYQAPVYHSYPGWPEIERSLFEQREQLCILLQREEPGRQDIFERIKEIEKNINNNPNNYSTNKDKITSVLSDLNDLDNADPRIQTARQTLEDLNKRNNDNWENSEWKKVQDTMDKFDQTWDKNDLDTLLRKLDDYKNEKDSPKGKLEYAGRLEGYYEQLRDEPITFRIEGHTQCFPDAWKEYLESNIYIDNKHLDPNTQITLGPNNHDELKPVEFQKKIYEEVELHVYAEGDHRNWNPILWGKIRHDMKKTMSLKSWKDNGVNESIWHLQLLPQIPPKPLL